MTPTIDHERMLDSLAAELDHSHPKAVKGAKAGGLSFGFGVVAVVRMLLAAGIPWVTIVTKIWDLIVTDRAAGKGVLEIARDLIARFFAGEFGPPPPGVTP